MAQDTARPVIIKRVRRARGGHHGGAWKIAYADFVTAMMAFFLLMWLLGSTTKAQLEGIAEYFQTPLKVALQGGPSTGSSQIILKGGGQDLTRQHGQVKRGEHAPDADRPRPMSYEEAKAELERQERLKLEQLKKRIEEAIDASPMLRQFKNQLLLDITTEGLRIQIVDEQNRPMFDLASAELKPYARAILLEIGKMLNGVPNKISLSGHTDGASYIGGERGYSNWELSADRANASRRELVAGGMDETKVLRVVGLSSAVLFDKENPLNPVNRRISIIVMNKQAEESIIKDDTPLDVPVEGDRSELEEAVGAKADN
ncbi:MAG TPA: flagellar motor protein MotB [Methylophilaceae bacterium]|jgi:chemotaxis protein MotB